MTAATAIRQDFPVEIARRVSSDQTARGEGLDISWNSGLKVFLSSRILRTSCPCAECLEKRGDRSHAQPLTQTAPPTRQSRLTVLKSTIDEETNLERIWTIGNYALGIRWQDGHDSGIYTFAHLRELCETAK